MWQLTVDNGYGVDIVTFISREAAENAANKVLSDEDEYTVSITIEEVND